MASGSPCGACKFLRRKCAPDCVFAPYFCSVEGPARFAAIHKVFGASNASKLLQQLPVSDRAEAIVTIAYEAQARLKDPVYGCVSHIFALQQQVSFLQAQLMQMKIQMAQGLVESSASAGNQWPINDTWQSTTMALHPTNPITYDLNYVSPQSSICSLGSIDPGSRTSGGANELRGGGGADDVSSNAYYAKLMDWESYKNCLLDS